MSGGKRGVSFWGLPRVVSRTGANSFTAVHATEIMASNSTDSRARGATLDDVAYLARSRHRLSMLVALTDRPRSRSELGERTEVSSSTIRRTLRAFEYRKWIHENDDTYEVTELGAFMASAMEDFVERTETERNLRTIWHLLPDEETGFSIEMCSDAVVSVAAPDDPYAPINRFESLLRKADTVRFLRPEVALMEPCFDVLRQRVYDGVDITLVNRPSCHEYFFSTYPEHSPELLKRGNFTVLEHDELPSFGLGLLDDRTVISCFEEDSGTVRALLDTDEPEATGWAETMFSSHERDARAVSLPETLPIQGE